MKKKAKATKMEARFMVALKSLADPVPELQSQVRECGGDGDPLWKLCPGPTMFLFAACFERLTTDQLLELLGPRWSRRILLYYTPGSIAVRAS